MTWTIKPTLRARAPLLAIFIVFSASTIAWNLLDKTPPPWDPADHMSAAYDYYRDLAHLDLAGFARNFFCSRHYYAPFVHLGTAVFFTVAGASRVSGILINLVSLAALLVSIEWICRHLYSKEQLDPAAAGSKSVPVSWPGVLAGLLAASYHFPAWLIHDAFLDYPLIAIVTVSVALLLKAGNFSRAGPAAAFGFSAGLGMLTKQTFVFFLFLPSLYAALQVFRARSSRGIRNLFLALLVAVAVAAIWYAPHFSDVVDIYNVNKTAAISENEAPILSFESSIHYLFGLVSPQMQLPLGLVFVYGLVYSLRRRRRQSLILYLWLIGGVFGFSLIANKDLRYTVPVLPAAAVISVSWLGSSIDMKRRASVIRARLRRYAPLAVGVWAFVSFFNAQWPRDGRGYYIDTPRFRWMVFARNYFSLDHRPLPNDWSVPQIVRTVAELGVVEHSRDRPQRGPSPSETVSPPTESTSDAKGRATVPTLGVVVNLPYLNPSSIAFYARMQSVEWAGPPVILIEWLAAQSSLDRISECDYLLVRTGLDQAEWVSQAERSVEAMLKNDPGYFERVAAFPIPLESAEAVIYRLRGGVKSPAAKK